VDDDEQGGLTSTAVRWKPWAPAIGQRVRIRLSAECPLLRAAPGEKETRTAWHSHAEEGHQYLVDFYPDALHFEGCISFCALYFAAPELEILSSAED
jgi:hypothetical protein